MSTPDQADETFTRCLDAAERYTAAQDALAAGLRSGFLALAKARYSMGPDRVSPLQFPSHMHASTRLAGGGNGEAWELIHVDPEPTSAGPGAEAPAGPRSSAGAAAARGGRADSPLPTSSGAGGPEAEGSDGKGQQAGLEEQLASLRLAAERAGSIVAELGAKYCEDSSSAAVSWHGDADQRPLHWFGPLVSPALREAEQQFAAALQLAVEAANAQAVLRRRLAAYQRAHPAPVPAGGDV